MIHQTASTACAHNSSTFVARAQHAATSLAGVRAARRASIAQQKARDAADLRNVRANLAQKLVAL